MTPGARVSAAISLLEAILAGAPAERVLTNWARGARYAGSGDRAAVRDHVFGALRCLRSFGALGGGTDGRAILLGSLRAQGIDPQAIFTGTGHDPAPLSEAERRAGRAPTESEARDLPDWLWPRFRAALGEAAAEAAAEALRHRAPICLRVNARRLSRAEAQARLAREGIGSTPLQGLNLALHVTEEERKIARAFTYREGLVELQDASSQAAMEALALPSGARVLDYCAGGGGKTLALAARLDGVWFAHDADPGRMTDLPARAARAGIEVRICCAEMLRDLSPFDAVLCDVPCSGSGTWRRAPQSKWSLTPEALEDLVRRQDGILHRAAELVRPGGQMIYATCSVLAEENEAVVEGFAAASKGWRVAARRRWPISTMGDGFFLAQLCREE